MAEFKRLPDAAWAGILGRDVRLIFSRDAPSESLRKAGQESVRGRQRFRSYIVVRAP
jgi:hypothetical protein